MKTVLPMAAGLLASAAPVAHAIDIQGADATPPIQGPEAYFTGSVRIAGLFQRTEPARVGGATVTFESGARTAWHTHPLGQTLIVTSGEGRVQEWGQPARVIRTGDVVWIPPGVKHWHGAAVNTAMTHVAIAEALDGNVVTWLEQVSDQQYR